MIERSDDLTRPTTASASVRCNIYTNTAVKCPLPTEKSENLKLRLSASLGYAFLVIYPLT
jgi:hypothetical protein